ncbi:MAG: M1 family aminopeptidase [Acidimicrobiales bacterium]
MACPRLPHFAAALVLSLTLVACRGTATPRAAPSAAPSSTSTTTTSLPRATSPSCPSIPARAAPAPDRPRYVLTADVRTAERVVSGGLKVRFTPNVDTDRLVFRLWPNGVDLSARGAKLDTGAVVVNGQTVAATADDPTTLVVHPQAVLRARQPVDVAVGWTLRLPGPTGDRISVDGDAVRLGSFFPILSWEPGVGWQTDPSTGGFAEDSTAPTADFDLTLTVPVGTSALASGVNDRPGHWTATAMRDVAVSVGRFTTATGVAHAPDPVAVTVGVQAGVGESPQAYRDKAIAVVEDFGRRFGPYPWPVLTLAVTPMLRGGIEYPGHVMLGPRTLSLVAAHEIGHQWFYALVGNDQGRDPWLDEGLATWAEARFDGALERLRATVVAADARDELGAPMAYWAAHRAAYQTGAYVQGAQALDDLGDPDLVDCALRVYVAQEAYGIARPSNLVAAASAVFPDAPATFARYGVRP